MKVVLGGAGVFGVGGGHGAAPEYAFDGGTARAVGGSGSRCALEVDVEGLAVCAGCALSCAGGNVVGVEGGVAAIAICIAAGLEVGEGFRVSGRSDCVQSWVCVARVVEELGWSIRTSSTGTLV